MEGGLRSRLRKAANDDDDVIIASCLQCIFPVEGFLGPKQQLSFDKAQTVLHFKFTERTEVAFYVHFPSIRFPSIHT